MSTSSGFGPNPWQQTSWDWRAAGNFICGGAGTGLLVASALFVAPEASRGWVIPGLVFFGLALVGLGLLCVWLEIGRPLRALNVFINPRTSWMSREAWVSVVLFPAGLAAMLGLSGWLWITAALALAFLYCQSRMLPAARGIPAWRSSWFSLLFLLTAACEGCGIFLLLGLVHGGVTSTALLAFVLLLALRMQVWRRYRSDVDASLATRARSALDLAGRRLLIVGSILPCVLLGLAWLLSAPLATLLAAVAGACAAWAGANLKYTLVTRASFNQGFALVKIPVRGVRDKQ
ncbi:MAG: DmsC/YnfH family molybdoenzyme membrane anchor subunit [Comamonadaceae bacterium]